MTAPKKIRRVKEKSEQEKIAAFLQGRGYEEIVPIYTALLIESLPPKRKVK